MVTFQIVEGLRFEELAFSSNSPTFSVVKLWRVKRNCMYIERFYKFTACFRECLLFLSVNCLFYMSNGNFT